LVSLRKRTEPAEPLRIAAEVVGEKGFQRFDGKPQVHKVGQRISLIESKSIPAKREKSVQGADDLWFRGFLVRTGRCGKPRTPLASPPSFR
jgi:hypothetical protein